MNKEGFGRRVYYFLRSVALLDLAIFVLVGILVLLLGWRTIREYGVGLTYAAVAALLVGLGSVIQSLGLSRSGEYQYAESVGANKLDENVRQAFRQSQASYGFFRLMACVALVAFVVGLLLASLG